MLVVMAERVEVSAETVGEATAVPGRNGRLIELNGTARYKKNHKQRAIKNVFFIYLPRFKVSNSLFR